MSMDQEANDGMDVESNWDHVASEIKKEKENNKPGEIKETNIQVAVRARPLNSKESGQRSVIRIQEATVVLDENGEDDEGNRVTSAGALSASSAPASFTYDYAFDQDSEQSEIFKVFGRDMVKDVILGFNCSVFAYGQTSSGKSYTMAGSDDQKGLIPRICECLFYGIEKMKVDNKSFRIQASYYEIYNEKVYDLLNPVGLALGNNDDDDLVKRKPLNVREDKKIGVFVDGLMHADVDTVDEANDIMSRGLRERTVQATKMNSVSSRSHAIFVLSIAQTLSSEEKKAASSPPASPRTPRSGFKKTGKVPKPLKKGDKKKSSEKPLKSSIQKAGQLFNMMSRLSLIDLAGSERSKTSGAEGGRLTESNNINLSLSTLGRCISALVKKAKGTSKNLVVIPFRDSVLTWLLRESLAGNARTRMMATVSPALVNSKETLSTLRYARSAKMITTKATVVQDPKEQRIIFLAGEVDRLKTQLSAFMASNNGNGDSSSNMSTREGGQGEGDNSPQTPRPFGGEGGPRKHRLGSMYGGSIDISHNGSSSSLMSPTTPTAGGFGGSGGSAASKGRSFAQTGAVMAELMNELELLTINENERNKNGRVSVDLMSDHLYIPATTFDLKQVRKLWRAKKYEHVPVAVITNLNADPLLTGKLLLHLNKEGGTLRIGRPGASTKQDLELEAEGIITEHCIIEYLVQPKEDNEDDEHNEEEEDDDEAVVAADPEQLFIDEDNLKWNRRITPKTPQAYIIPLKRFPNDGGGGRRNSQTFNFGQFDDEDDYGDNLNDLDEIDEIAEVHVNGKRVVSRQAIHHGDRLVFGACTYAGLFVECPKILKLKLEREQVELDLKHESNGAGVGFESVVGHHTTSIDMVEAMRKHENKIDKATYTEALHEVLRASVAKANSLRRTLSLAPPVMNKTISKAMSGENDLKREDERVDQTKGVHFSETPSVETRVSRSPDRQGQEVSADLMHAHGAVRQTNFIARELGLGLVFSIVLKSDVNSHVSLVDTDIDDLLTWKNVTVNIEATCYLPAGDEGSDSDDNSTAFKPLTEPHHLLTCSAAQFGDIAEAFSKSRSLLKRCVRRVSNMIKHSKIEEQEILAQEALRGEEEDNTEDEEEEEEEEGEEEEGEEGEEEEEDGDEEGGEKSFNRIFSERVDSFSEGDGTLQQNEGDEEGENEEAEVVETKEERRLRKEKKKKEKEMRKEEKKMEKHEKKNSRNLTVQTRQVSKVDSAEESGVLNQGSGWKGDQGRGKEGGDPSIWAAPTDKAGRFDRHSFSVSRPDVDAALQDERILSPSLARGGSVMRQAQTQQKKALHILKRVFNALYEASIDDEGRVSHHNMHEEEALLAYSKQQLNPSQVALGLCMLGMMESTRGIKLRLRQAERFMEMYNAIANHKKGVGHSKKKSGSTQDASSSSQTYDSFAYGVVEHIRLCVIGAVLEDVVYELTESSPAVLRAFLTRSALTNVHQDSMGQHEGGSGVSHHNTVPKAVNEATKVALSQMEERAIRAEKMLEDQRNRNNGLFYFYDNLRNVALTRFMGDNQSLTTSDGEEGNNVAISSSELLSHFKPEDQMKASGEWEMLISNEAKSLELKHEIEEANFEKKEVKMKLDQLMFKMKSIQGGGDISDIQDSSSITSSKSQGSNQLNQLNESKLAEDLSTFTYELVVLVTSMKLIDEKIEILYEKMTSCFEQKATASEHLLQMSVNEDEDDSYGDQEEDEDEEKVKEKKKKKKKKKKEHKRTITSLPLDKALQNLRSSFEADPETTMSSFFGRGIRI